MATSLPRVSANMLIWSIRKWLMIPSQKPYSDRSVLRVLLTKLWMYSQKIVTFSLSISSVDDSSTNITVGEFTTRMEFIFNLNFTVYPSVCSAMQKKFQQCETISKRTEPHKALRRKVASQIAVANKFCDLEISALGGWRVEQCVLDGGFVSYGGKNSPITVNELSHCASMYRCLLHPTQSIGTLDLWNSSTPALSLAHPNIHMANSFGGGSRGSGSTHIPKFWFTCIVVLIGAFMPLSLSKKLVGLLRTSAVLNALVVILANVILWIYIIDLFVAQCNPHAHNHLFSTFSNYRCWVFCQGFSRYRPCYFDTVAWKFLVWWDNYSASDHSSQQWNHLFRSNPMRRPVLNAINDDLDWCRLYLALNLTMRLYSLPQLI